MRLQVSVQIGGKSDDYLRVTLQMKEKDVWHAISCHAGSVCNIGNAAGIQGVSRTMVYLMLERCLHWIAEHKKTQNRLDQGAKLEA